MSLTYLIGLNLQYKTSYVKQLLFPNTSQKKVFYIKDVNEIPKEKLPTLRCLISNNYHQNNEATPTKTTKGKTSMETSNSEKEKPNKVTRKGRQRYNKHIYHNLYHNNINCIKNNCNTCAKSFVANLSGKDLTDPQILLLSNGLSFCPQRCFPL